MTFDHVEYARFIDLLRANGVEPSTVPARPGEKIPACRWAEMKPGEQGPHWPKTEARLLLTGSRSGGVCVVDIDTKNGGFETFAAFEAEHKPLCAPMCTVRSPTGGLHLFYRPEAMWKTCTNSPVQSVDLRGEGGLVMVPGSRHPKGGIYRLEDVETPTLGLRDPGWSLPVAGAPRTALPLVEPVYVPVGAIALRQRLLDACKHKKGPAWQSLRKVAVGERMVCLGDGPKDASAPTEFNIDAFMSTQVIWTLATHPEFIDVAPEEIGQLFASSLSILRADAAEANRPDPSLWSVTHLESKWVAATQKARAKASADDAFLAKIGSLGSPGPLGSNGAELPLIVQIAGNSFRVLCRDLTYQAADAGSLWVTCRDAWNEEDRPIHTPKGKRMRADDLVAAYGKRGEAYVLDHRIFAPKFEGGELVAPPKRGTLPDPIEHAEVDEWLRALFGPHAETALDWLACSGVARLGGFLPALALVGPPGCGKTVLGEAIARTHGTPSQPLESLLGTFHDGADASSVFLADERTVRDDRGIPRTQEIRSVITSAERRINPKGQTPFKVRGAVRLVFTANSFEAVFPMVGSLGDDDVKAIAERFLYCEVTRDRGMHAKGLIDAIGGGEMGARIDAVAQHIRHLQESRTVASGGRFMVSTNGAELDRRLARSSSGLAEVLERLESPGQIHARSDGVWFVSPDRLATAIGSARLSAQKVGTVVREHLALRDAHGEIVAPHLRNAWGAPRAKAVALDRSRLSALVDPETLAVIVEAASVVVPVARVN